MLGSHVVVQDEGVVLVGRERLLLTGPGPQGHPAVGDRRRPEVGLGQSEHATLDRITNRSDDPADVLGRRVLRDKQLDDGGQAFAHLGHRADVLGLGDVPDEVDRVGLFQAHQVGRRDDAFRGPVGAEDRQVVNVATGHLHEDLERQGIGRPGERIGGHHARHREVGVDPRGHDPVA